MKKKIKFVLYNLLVIIFLFVVSEFTIRLIYPEIKSQGTDKKLMIENAYSGSPGLKPNSSGISNGVELKVNALGFRECSVPFDTTKICRIFIGDSVTMGLGDESDSTFPARLQKQLPNVNIINASMFGYSLEDYLNLFHHLMKDKDKLKIRQINLCWSLNDIYLGKINEYEMPGGSVRYFINDILTWFRWHSRLYTFIKTMVSDRSKKYLEFDTKFYDEKNEIFNKAIDSIKSISEVCRKNRIDFNFIILPYEYQIRVPGNNIPQKLLKKYLEKDSIKVIDLLPCFENKNIDSGKLYLFGDGIHFSSYGHRRIAEFIFLAIK
jgi:lysophospholipase L1-like esterase